MGTAHIHLQPLRLESDDAALGGRDVTLVDRDVTRQECCSLADVMAPHPRPSALVWPGQGRPRPALWSLLKLVRCEGAANLMVLMLVIEWTEDVVGYITRQNHDELTNTQ